MGAQIDSGLDISVCLTTSGHVAEDSPVRNLNLEQLDVPICVVEVDISPLGGRPSEEAEHRFAETLKSGFGKVAVKDWNVVVATDLDDITSALIDYTEDNRDSQFAKDFFGRWAVTQSMVLEFQAFHGKDLMFTIMGLWVKDRWTTVEIMHRPPMLVKTPEAQ
jgi:hypothetical protein